MRHRRHRHLPAARHPHQPAARHQRRLALPDELDVKRERALQVAFATTSDGSTTVSVCLTMQRADRHSGKNGVCHAFLYKRAGEKLYDEQQGHRP